MMFALSSTTSYYAGAKLKTTTTKKKQQRVVLLAAKASSSSSSSSSSSNDKDDEREEEKEKEGFVPQKGEKKEEQKKEADEDKISSSAEFSQHQNYLAFDSPELRVLSERMRLVEIETILLRDEYNKMVVKAMRTPKDFIEWNERNGFNEKGESLAEKQPKKKRLETENAKSAGGEAKKRREEIDERIRKTDEFLREKMNGSSLLPEGFLQKMSKVLGDQNSLFSSVEEIFEKRLGEEQYKKYLEEKQQKAADEKSSMITNVALVNLNCVEDFSPLFVLVFHHGHNSPEQAGIYSLQEKATPEELPVDTILAFMTKEDAERYAKLLKSSLGTVPIVESVTKSELALTCRVGGHRCVVSNKGYELAPPKESLRVTDWERSNMLRSGAWRVVGEDDTCTISDDDLSLDWKTQGMELMASYREEAKRERLENARERLERLYRKGTLGKNEEDHTDPDDHSE